jgi:hypothetical protein
MEVIPSILLILKNWWWFLLAIVLWFPVKFFYLFWLRWEVWYPKTKWILLEIKPPKEILKPFKAMENIFSSLWGTIDIPNWREQWCEGMLPLGGGLWFSFEVASFGGKVHFYLRCPEKFRNNAEALIYAQYPDAEIFLADDYTKNVPQNLPNKEWNLNGEDYQLKREDAYPIKTYLKFFEEKPEQPKEEKRIDPMDFLLEAFSKVSSEEQLWLQICCIPITNGLIPWATRGKEIRDEIAKRKKPKKEKSMIQEAIEILIFGPPKETKSTEETEAPLEFKLTPGEKEILIAIENKISKHAFNTFIRTVHLWKRDKPYLAGKHLAIRSYFMQFATEHLNSIGYLGTTRTRIHYILPSRRVYVRQKRQFRNYIKRIPSYFPRLDGKPPFLIKLRILGESKGPGLGKSTMILNIEELATIFHFPSKVIVPGVSYVETKKAGPPLELPTE